MLKDIALDSVALVLFGDKGTNSNNSAELYLHVKLYVEVIVVENHIIIPLKNRSLLLRLQSLQMRIFLVEDLELTKPSI